MSKIVYSLSKTINFYETQILVGSTQNNAAKSVRIVFRKVNWPLLLRRGLGGGGEREGAASLFIGFWW